MKLKSLVGAAACAVLCLPAFAQVMKPGLWEMTSKMGGNPELEQAMAEMHKQLANMPAEQRKQMEAAMGQHGMQMQAGAGGATAVKMCLTREMVERSDFGQAQGDCKTTRHDRSGSTMKMAWTCTNPPSNGEGEYTFVGSEGYRSKVRMTHTMGGKPETTTIEGSGRWLGADCGSVRPMAPTKK
jgi:hypothetical protein